MSEFSGEGFQPFPNLFSDNKRVGEFSEWPTPVLEERTSQYVAFLQRDDLMARAKAQAERITEHLLFELAYRDGIYDEYTTKHEDELCEEGAI